jgi:VWFA-related protein
MKNKIVVMFAAVGCWGQTPDVTQKEAPTPASFSSRTNLVVVPVVVRDGKGRAIGNLTKEDFQLFDKGKLQTISRFSVEKTSERAATQAAQVKAAAEASGETESPGKDGAMPSRYVAYMFDDLHTEMGDLYQTRVATGKHLDKTLVATDRASIVSASGNVMLDFTDDRMAMHGALDQIKPNMTSMIGAGCPRVSLNVAYAFTRNDPKAYQAVVESAMQCMALDRSLSASAGLGDSVARTALDSILQKDEQNTRLMLSTLGRLVRRMATLPGERIIVLVSSGFILDRPDRTMESASDESALIDLAVRNKIVINTLDARGLYVVIQGGDATQPFTTRAGTTANQSAENTGASVASEAVAQIADDTGGTFIHNSNDYEGAMKLLGGAPEFQYFLGFSPQNLRIDGSFHQIKVSIKAKGTSLQARRGYYAPKRAVDEAEQTLAELRESLFSRDEMMDIPITMQTQFFKATPEEAKLSVLARMDLHEIHFRKNEGRNLDTVVFVTGLFDRNGNLIKGITKTVDLHVRDEDLPQRLAAGLSAKTTFDVAPGKYVIRLVVRDSEGQAMAAKNGLIEIP